MEGKENMSDCLRVAGLGAASYWSNATNNRLRIYDTDRYTSSAASGNQVEIVRGALDAEMRAVTASLLAVKKRYNALSPVSRLFPEIISIILQFHAINEPHHRAALTIHQDVLEHHGAEPRLGWIRASHVCQRWRDVAISTPGLWSVITLILGQDWAREMLRRSKAVPLRLDLWDPFCRSTDVLIEIANHLSRVKSIDVTMNDMSSLASFSFPAPELHTFRARIFYDVEEFPESGQLLPSNLFAGNAPLLKHLVASCLEDFSWESTLLRNVTDLRVDQCPDFHPRDGYRRMLDALRGMPQLTSLNVHQSFEASDTFQQYPRVSLPALTQLSIYHDVLNVARLSDRITWPRSAHVWLEALLYDTDRAFDVEDALQVVQRRFRAHEVGVGLLQTLSFYVSPTPSGERDIFYHGSYDRQSLSDDRKVGEEISLRVYFHEEQMTSLFDLINVTPLHSLRVMMFILQGCAPDASFWRATFSEGKMVEHIGVSWSPGMHFFDSLAAATTDPPPSAPHSSTDTSTNPPVVLPNLVSLTLDNINWNARCGGQEPGSANRTNFQVLRDALWRRWELGVPVCKIYMDLKRLDNMKVDELISFVRELKPLEEHALHLHMDSDKAEAYEANRSS